MSPRLRGRLIVIAGAAMLLLIAGAAALVRSRPPSCGLAAPVPDLPPRLQALGDFDRPYDTGDERTLEEAAGRVASALHPGLIGTLPDHSVAVAALAGDHHNARVVPLLTASPGGRPRDVAALVSFLLDCGGRAYYAGVEDLSGQGGAPLTGFPRPGREDAAVALGGGEVRLVYHRTPLRPDWHSARTGAEIPAR
ncbi:MAG: hypothetical protein LC685_00890 [Actinobacteria bacterium]|nr:hypothetical protein [Actinomycetota bacterium]